jgi:zinc transport system substrate-binding protein
MKPTNAQDLQDADVVFWLGHGLEAFLEKPLETLSGKAKVMSFLELDGIKTLAPRESGTFEHHDDEDHDHTQADAGEEIDAHIWLDPDNAKTMTRAIAATLSSIDPDHAKRYEANAEANIMRLDTLSQTIATMIAPVKDRPFIVFHDAYQYFEQRFGVQVAGSITVSPETVPGAARISEIHQKVKDLGATCVFSEPQFEPKLVRVVMEGSAARTGVLDPEGANLPAGPDLYPDLMLSIAKGLKDCLAGG